MNKLSLLTKVYAESGIPSGEMLGSGLNITSINTLVIWVTNLIIIFGMAAVIIMVALAFIGFATSQGDEDKAKNAQNWLTYAVIGGVGLFLVYALRQILMNTILGEDVLNNV